MRLIAGDDDAHPDARPSPLSSGGFGVRVLLAGLGLELDRAEAVRLRDELVAALADHAKAACTECDASGYVPSHVLGVLTRCKPCGGSGMAPRSVHR